LLTLKAIVQFTNIIFISANEVMVVNETYWLGVNAYNIDCWERILHLLHSTCIFENKTANHLINLIMHALFSEGGLICEEIARKLVCFGANGVNTFQELRMEVMIQIREKWALFCISIFCVSHRLNLAVETMSKLPMVSRLKGLF